jgi:hypothetical protein
LQAESEQAKQKAVSWDFTYDNLGVSRNPMNPFYAKADVHPVGGTWIDLGLEVRPKSPAEPIGASVNT